MIRYMIYIINITAAVRLIGSLFIYRAFQSSSRAPPVTPKAPPGPPKLREGLPELTQVAQGKNCRFA